MQSCVISKFFQVAALEHFSCRSVGFGLRKLALYRLFAILAENISFASEVSHGRLYLPTLRNILKGLKREGNRQCFKYPVASARLEYEVTEFVAQLKYKTSVKEPCRIEMDAIVICRID